jgi:acetylornithine deacetylase/succinyl-diaminopimelate desuccinylase-like protein
MTNRLQVSDSQFNHAIDQLGKFVAIPSLSNVENPDFSMSNLIFAANFSGESLKELGFDVDYVRIDNCAPFVVAQKKINKDLPTLTLYAHYDVQPVERDKWVSNPFVMTERDGRLYGRGASDDKGGIIAILTTLQMYKDAGIELPVNVNILFEGEEEYGSSHMGALLEQCADKLDAKALVVLDGMNRSIQSGSLTSSTRGIVNISLEVKALAQPVHSGIGCLVPDPAMALALLVTSLNNPKEIPGLMDGFEPMSKEEEEIYAKDSITAAEYAKDHGVVDGATLRGDPSVSIFQRTVEEPSLSIVNMTAGQPKGGNSIQATAQCTIGIRALPGQDPEVVGAAVMDHLKKQPVWHNIQVDIKQIEGAWAWKGNMAGGFSKLYLEALAENFPSAGALPCGGALPLLREFQTRFPNMEMIVPAVEDPRTTAHSHNESQDIGVFRSAINSLAAFLDKAGQVS